MADMRNNRASCPCGNCKALTDQLRKIDFAIYETVLYLDAYPDCARALSYYNELMTERCRIADAVNEACGPLTHRDNRGGEWLWTKGPWPWQIDAN